MNTYDDNEKDTWTNLNPNSPLFKTLFFNKKTQQYSLFPLFSKEEIPLVFNYIQQLNKDLDFSFLNQFQTLFQQNYEIKKMQTSIMDHLDIKLFQKQMEDSINYEFSQNQDQEFDNCVKQQSKRSCANLNEFIKEQLMQSPKIEKQQIQSILQNNESPVQVSETPEKTKKQNSPHIKQNSKKKDKQFELKQKMEQECTMIPLEQEMKDKLIQDDKFLDQFILSINDFLDSDACQISLINEGNLAISGSLFIEKTHQLFQTKFKEVPKFIYEKHIRPSSFYFECKMLVACTCLINGIGQNKKAAKQHVCLRFLQFVTQLKQNDLEIIEQPIKKKVEQKEILETFLNNSQEQLFQENNYNKNKNYNQDLLNEVLNEIDQEQFMEEENSKINQAIDNIQEEEQPIDFSDIDKVQQLTYKQILKYQKLVKKEGVNYTNCIIESDILNGYCEIGYPKGILTINNYFGVLEKNYALPELLNQTIELNSQFYQAFQTNIDNVNIFLKSLLLIEQYIENMNLYKIFGYTRLGNYIVILFERHNNIAVGILANNIEIANYWIYILYLQQRFKKLDSFNQIYQELCYKFDRYLRHHKPTCWQEEELLKQNSFWKQIAELYKDEIKYKEKKINSEKKKESFYAAKFHIQQSK